LLFTIKTDLRNFNPSLIDTIDPCWIHSLIKDDLTLFIDIGNLYPVHLFKVLLAQNGETGEVQGIAFIALKVSEHNES
jgi:hypothetical protein